MAGKGGGTAIISPAAVHESRMKQLSLFWHIRREAVSDGKKHSELFSVKSMDTIVDVAKLNACEGRSQVAYEGLIGLIIS
jgi:hypothetical protein